MCRTTIALARWRISIRTERRCLLHARPSGIGLLLKRSSEDVLRTARCS